MAMFSYFGIGAAAGVVVNDNLVLVDYVERLRKEGKNAADAVVTAGVARFRPILLTSVTTFVGLMPIMAERSTDAQFLKPAVLSLAFGVLFALFVSLLMVPALYCVGDDINAFLTRVKDWFRQQFGDGDESTAVESVSSEPMSSKPISSEPMSSKPMSSKPISSETMASETIPVLPGSQS
jgi:predicted RND superfamily exporter protein